MSGNVQVSVRVKPPSGSSVSAVRPVTGGLSVLNQEPFTGFVSVVGGSDQEVAYDAVAAPLIEQLMEGYSCTLMAYGQTGSGKTHTIFGPPGALTETALRGENDGHQGAQSAPPDWGLFPRIALDLLAAGKGTLHASAVEVYQERAFDLLADRAPLVVGAQKAGRKVGQKAAGDAGNNGVHPSNCNCRTCYIAKKDELTARLAKRNATQGAAARSNASKEGKAKPMSFAELSGASAKVQACRPCLSTVACVSSPSCV